MAIDFTLTKEQQEVQMLAREFAQDVLAPSSGRPTRNPTR